MNVFEFLQNLAAEVPLLIQPLIVALAAAIPFIEGELASVLGVWAGLHPVVAALAAVTGNFLSVLLVVFFGARIRAAILARRARRAQSSPAAVGPGIAGAEANDPEATGPEGTTESKGVKRLKRFLVRFGVPGASILGPLALPTQFTAAVLVSTGVSKQWVLLWQAIAIVLWTSLTTLIATGVLSLVTA
ncbi:small multidrug efflux protein [Microbacterium hydrocarbonoxydans]|uniref:small multidrug efflux protein n=1 Tax=Microbacterium hydrocarbonoxydans TaxID=273678 RepID=UPI002041E460|nr:small multidrug efflux protein [Microbacterium hydrocarbonoxydans]MCM3778666.1 small multidrug efflux protein [Microbacterium hydrocarbonoxydans]